MDIEETVLGGNFLAIRDDEETVIAGGLITHDRGPCGHRWFGGQNGHWWGVAKITPVRGSMGECREFRPEIGGKRRYIRACRCEVHPNGDACGFFRAAIMRQSVEVVHAVGNQVPVQEVRLKRNIIHLSQLPGGEGARQRVHFQVGCFPRPQFVAEGNVVPRIVERSLRWRDLNRSAPAVHAMRSQVDKAFRRGCNIQSALPEAPAMRGGAQQLWGVENLQIVDRCVGQPIAERFPHGAVFWGPVRSPEDAVLRAGVDCFGLIRVDHQGVDGGVRQRG